MVCGNNCGAALVQVVLIGLSNGALLALNAVAISLIYSLIRTLNLAHGDLFALLTVLVTATVQALVRSTAGLWAISGSIALALALAVLAGAGGSLLIERTAFRPFRERSRLAPLIATIALSFALYQLALFLRTLTNVVIPGEHRSVPGVPEVARIRIPELLPTGNIWPRSGGDFAIIYRGKDLLVLLVAIGVSGLVTLLLRSTRWGRALRACAADPDMAPLCGINRQRVISGVFALGGALAGVAAWMHGLYYTHPATNYGVQSGLIAFAAAILGGIGQPLGALLSSLLIGVIMALGDYFWAAQWTPVLLLVLLIALLLLRPQGLSAGAELVEQLADIRRRSNLRAYALAAPALLVLLLGLGGLLLRAPLQLTLISALIYGLLALGMTVPLGFAGLLDLSFAAYFALGAYTTGLLTQPYGRLELHSALLRQYPFLLLVSALVAALLGVWHGLLTRRLRGEYLAIATLASGLIVPRLLVNSSRLTNGAGGLSALPPPRLFGLVLTSPSSRMLLAAGLVALVALACMFLTASRQGRAWAALNIDEQAAESCGVPVVSTRLLAFSLGAAIAGMAGSLFAATWSYIYPDLAAVQLTTTVLAIVVVGGTGSVVGAIGGALLVVGVDQVLIPRLGAWMQLQGGLLNWLDVRDLNFLTFGLILYLAVLWRTRRTRPLAQSGRAK